MKIIFLDIDGVLVISKTFNERLGKYMVADATCISNLNKIVDATKAKVVISSAWKYCGLMEMSLILRYWGFEGEVIGLVPNIEIRNEEFSREDEIQEYLNNHNSIESFVILDDMSLQIDNLVKTKFEDGLTKEETDKAIRILNSN